jgi:CrcB protein
MEILFAGLGGFTGSILRYIISKKLNKKNAFPKGTFLVNLSGAFLLGLFFNIFKSSGSKAFMLTGILGAFTTFSTYMLESFDMLKDRKYKMFMLYTITTLIAGTLFYMLGFSIKA